MQAAYQSGLQLVQSIETSHRPEEELSTLQRLCEVVQSVEDASRVLQQTRWPDATSPSEGRWTQLVEMRDQAAQLAHSLITRVDQALEVRRAGLSRLTPEMDEQISRQRMVEAYGRRPSGVLGPVAQRSESS